MARSRNIKPGFFTNDVLGELPALTRLLFAGIWTLCDRDGRLEDRPKKIRAEVLPYDVCDAEEMLQALGKHGFIQRYEVNGVKVIQVSAWEKHQNPHIKESPSTLPALGQHQTSTVQAPDTAQPLPEQAGLIPDSLLLIPDSLNRAKALLPSDKLPACPHEALIDLFGKHLPALPQPKKELWTGKNADAMRARWRWVLTAKRKSGEPYASDAAQGQAWFGKFFDHVEQSDFLTGRSGKWTGCDLGWLMKAENFTKAVQGNYENKGQP